MTRLIKLIQRLAVNEVDFVLVGGLAAATHGSSMLTQDVDICCNFELSNLKKLQRAVEDLNPIHRMGLGRFRNVSEQSIRIDLTAFRCKVLSLPALIQAKEAMGRPRDKENVFILKGILEKQNNENQVRK